MSSTIAQYIIDPSGELWDADKLAVTQAVGRMPLSASAQTLTEGLVMNRGYAGYRVSDRACQVFINPQRMREPTLVKLRSLVDRQTAPLMISWYYRGHWDFEMHVSKGAGLDQIAAHVDQAQAQPANCFRARTVSEADLARDGSGALADAMDLVRGCNRQFDEDLLPKLAKMTQRRFMICRWRSQGRLWRIEHSGAGYRSSHIDVSQHRTVSNQPSFEYGCWIHDRYLETMMRATPSVEEVDALVTTPGVGVRRMRYRRVLAPMTDAAGNALLLSTSVRDTTIDLGAGGAGPSLENVSL